MPTGSPSLVLGFCVLVALVVVAGVLVARRWGGLGPAPAVAGLGAWMLVSGGLAHSGLLARWDLRPPPTMLLAMVGLCGTVLLSRTAWARRLAESAPLFVLIGFQAYRFPLELLMHRAYSEGVMPVQMSFEGRNFDIVTGLLAIALGAWAWRGAVPRSVVWAFNVLGLALLVNVVGIAIASMPIFAAFGPDRLNVWITWLPFVWLPTIFVAFALLGHLLLFRRLRSDRPLA